MNAHIVQVRDEGHAVEKQRHPGRHKSAILHKAQRNNRLLRDVELDHKVQREADRRHDEQNDRDWSVPGPVAARETLLVGT